MTDPTPTYRISLHSNAIRVSLSDGGSEDVAMADAPDLAIGLLKRGDVVAARCVMAVWFVAQANAAGLSNVTLGP